MNFFLLWLIIFWNVISWGAFSNYNSILIGNQVAGMGGAGTAVVGDVAASPFYNPATLGYLDGSAFSAAVGVYKKFDTLYGKEEDFTRAPLRVNQGYFRSIPSSVGSALKIKNWLFALSIVVPDYDTFKGELYNKGDDVTTLSYVDESLWVGGGVATKVSSTEAFGFSLYYTARNFNRSLSDKSFPSATTANIFTSEQTKQDNTVVAIFGYYKKFSRRWALGVSVRPRSFIISSKVSTFESTTTVDTGSSTLSKTQVNEPDRDGDFVIPGRFSVGCTYVADSTLIFSADASYYEGVSYEDVEKKNVAIQINHRPIWNYQLGAQKDLLKWLKVRLGVFTDFSSHPDPDTINRLQSDHADLYGFSANFVLVAGNKIGYSFGGYYNGGRGISRQRVNQNYQTVGKTQQIFTMLLGTSFFF